MPPSVVAAPTVSGAVRIRFVQPLIARSASSPWHAAMSCLLLSILESSRCASAGPKPVVSAAQTARTVLNPLCIGTPSRGGITVGSYASGGPFRSAPADIQAQEREGRESRLTPRGPLDLSALMTRAFLFPGQGSQKVGMG